MGALQTVEELNSSERPTIDLYRLAQEFNGITSEELFPVVINEIDFELNDRLDFIIDKDLAGDFRAQPAILRHISENAYWWKGVTTQADDEQIVAAARLFEDQIIKTNRELFGTEWSPGIDIDSRIHILLIDEPGWGDTIGYFNSLHEYPSSIEPNSNQKEMVIINLGAVSINSKAFAGELAKAYQEMIHWNQDANEEPWFKEAMSTLAAFLNGAPPADNGFRYSDNELFASDPATQLNSHPDVRATEDEVPYFPHYAAERLFAIYLYEQFGPQLIKDIVMNPAPGISGIQEALEKLPGSPSFLDIFADWIVANLLNRTTLDKGQFGYQEIRPTRPKLETVESFTGEPIADQLPPYSARYYEVRHNGPVQVDFTGSTMTRLTPADPVSGDFAWYSTRGDESEFTLARIFDISVVDSATLRFKVWYQLEEHHDYAYVEISLDGGRTWEILDTIHGTDSNPYNAALGTGYTGSTPDWKFDSVDLTPYTGQKVQIRFHVITDSITSWEGFQVDDITIPEIGYFDGAEDDFGGWITEGFIRSSNIVPVEWIMWLVKNSNPIQVERLNLTPDQTANFETSGLSESYNQAIIVVSPTAQFTTTGIDYEIKFEE
jgi:immune inhibitor A